MTVPTKEQIEAVIEQIKDVESRNYIESDGDQASCWFQPEGGGVVGRALFQGAPIGELEPFADLPSRAKAELLVTCVDWEGFTVDQRHDVSRRVIDGEGPPFWMDGVQVLLDARSENPKGQTIGEFAEEERQGRVEDWVKEEHEYHRPLEGGPGMDTVIGPSQAEAFQVRPLTEQLIDATHLDLWPSVAVIVDFGIDSESHLGALQYAIKHGEVTPQELDAAMGNGAKLTEIAQRGDNPYRDVTFRTSWDLMQPEPADEPKWYDTKALFAEIRADELAASGIDNGGVDAATHGQREEGVADAVQHLEPQSAILMGDELDRMLTEIEKSWQPGQGHPATLDRAEALNMLGGTRSKEAEQGRDAQEKEGREL
jgi:hypothetical protein